MRERIASCAVAIAALGTCVPAVADIWKFVDGNGVVHIADRPLGPGYERILRSRASPASPRAGADRRRYAPIIDRVATRYRIDRALVHAVVSTESGYDPGAISPKGAVGLMQLMPETARRYGVRDRRDPVQNVTGGVRYLRDLLLRFRNLHLALAAYNAGENAVARYGNRIPPYAETREYIRRVLAHWRALRRRS